MDRPVTLAPLATRLSRHNQVNTMNTNNRFNNTCTISIPQSRTDINSHVDTYVVGRNILLTYHHEANGHSTYVNVLAYDPIFGSVPDMCVVSATVAYDFPETGGVVVFKINQAVHINSTENNLLCNIQPRMNEINVFECPTYLTENSCELDHTLVIAPLEGNNDMIVPLSFNGFISDFSTRKPTIQKYELTEDEGRSYNLTYDSPEWDPPYEIFAPVMGSRPLAANFMQIFS